MRFLVIIALSSMYLGGCGNGLDTDADLPRFDVPDQAKRSQFLEEFPLLDASGNEAPFLDPVTGKAPFGAMVYMPLSGKGAYCTLTHARMGEVLVNAHCVEDDSDPSNYFIIFYGHDGQKKVYRIGNFISVGSSENKDYARLRISNRAANEFDTLNANMVSTASEIQAEPPVVHRVSVWSYDPLYRHADVYSRYNHAGMMAKGSNDCDMSRTKPVVLAMSANGATQTPISSPTVNTEYHVIVDNCTKELVGGNSGSLITAQGNPSIVYGTYHWAILPGDKTLQTYPCFDYTGNRSVDKQFCPSKNSSGDLPSLFGVGTSLAEIFN